MTELQKPLFWSLELVIKVVGRWFSTREGLGFLVLDLKLCRQYGPTTKPGTSGTTASG